MTFSRFFPLALMVLSLLIIGGCSHPADPTAEAQETVDVETPIEAPAQVDSNSNYGPAELTDYSSERYESMLGQEPMVLFFHADWCAICNIMEQFIRDNWSDFPAGTTILKVNYDKEEALKQTYGVTNQSTIVVLDAEGTVTFMSIFPTHDQLIAAIKGSL